MKKKFIIEKYNLTTAVINRNFNYLYPPYPCMCTRSITWRNSWFHAIFCWLVFFKKSKQLLLLQKFSATISNHLEDHREMINTPRNILCAVCSHPYYFGTFLINCSMMLSACKYSCVVQQFMMKVPVKGASQQTCHVQPLSTR